MINAEILILLTFFLILTIMLFIAGCTVIYLIHRKPDNVTKKENKRI